MNSQIKNRQSGFIILMGMLILVLGAAAWFGSVSQLRSESISIENRDKQIRELQRIKERMLTYAVMQPEIFRTDGGSNIPRAQVDIPGPGYFPCPDTNGDGNSNAPCGGAGVDFVIGQVPESVAGRFFTFTNQAEESNSYWYAVDARFLTANPAFTYDGTRYRFVPLNRASPDTLADPAITLDGVADIVMILFYAGEPVRGINQDQSVFNVNNFLELENADGDGDFISNFANPDLFNDYVIPITRREWNASMLSRVSKDVMAGVTPGTAGDNVPDLCDLVGVNDLHWFNQCAYAGAAPGYAPDPACNSVANVADQNLFGQDWRGDLGCP